MIEMNNHMITANDLLEEFILDCKVRNLAEDTIKYYKKKFGYLCDFILTDILEDNKTNIDIKLLHKDTIVQYIVYMQDKGLKTTTININLRAIRTILYYAMDKEYISRFEIKMLKEETVLKDLFKDKEIEILLKKPDTKKCTFAEYRTWALTNFLVGTGVRSRSVRNIKIKDIDLDEDNIYITKTKNKRQIVLPMSKTLKKVLIEYLKIRGGEQEEYLFCNLNGEQLTENAIGNVIRKYNFHRGINKSGLHLYRHYFAKSYVMNGGDICRLQIILGHSSLDVTKRYVELFGIDLKVGFDKSNPLDCLMGNKDRIVMIRGK